MRQQTRSVLVIQWARLGDLFHSRPICEEIKRMQPMTEVSFCYDARYESVATQFPEVDNTIPLNLRLLVAKVRNDALIGDALADVLDIASLVSRFDEVYNLTNHSSAITFSGLCQSATIYGYGHSRSEVLEDRGAEWGGESRHIALKWTQLANPDAKLKFPAALTSENVRHPKNRIAIICDAGSLERSLSESTINRIVHESTEAGLKVSLVGSRSAARMSATCCQDVKDYRGETTLVELMKVLDSCSYVVGPDTGALHFAAALGRKVFGIYLDGANPSQTGPLSREATCIISHEQDQEFMQTLAVQFPKWLGSQGVDSMQPPMKQRVASATAKVN